MEYGDLSGYVSDINNYKRRHSHEVNIGGVALGGENPIRIQSMTTVDTMDTIGSVEQCIRMIESGCEYIRITAPSIKEAENLRHIKSELRARGYETPLVADIHFTPNAAEVAARIVEKVRVNPGNYADKKKFDIIEYSDIEYEAELERIREKFTPLVQICKDHGTAMRIGTNHGSLSDRIMSRYGDTPFGMVESALEFLRITNSLDFHDIVLSMKSSNTQVMVQAYRLLVHKMDEEGLKPYPLHLGVTEAGEGEDGRIKSAVGIGTLLQEGIGDTVRVSLTEEPEFEAPVARMLVGQLDGFKTKHKRAMDEVPFHPFEHHKRSTCEAGGFGGDSTPQVVADLRGVVVDNQVLKGIGYHYLNATDKWASDDHAADLIYVGNRAVDFMLPNGLRQCLDLGAWEKLDVSAKSVSYPVCKVEDLHKEIPENSIIYMTCQQALDNVKALQGKRYAVWLESVSDYSLSEWREVFASFNAFDIQAPVVLVKKYNEIDGEKFQIEAASNFGALFIDGFGDGIMLTGPSISLTNTTAFGILQAARLRMTKTEYISCPSCGRTLFDLQETTAKIRKRTDHLKGVKIGIMGCIVNGPGEMADADFGYVGSGKGKITLYKGQEVIKRGVPSDNAVDELISIIKEDGRWLEPSVGVETV